MFFLLMETVVVPFFCFNSEIVVPEIYAKNAGIIGKIQGATKDPTPASAAIASVTSAMDSNLHFFIYGLFQKLPKSLLFVFNCLELIKNVNKRIIATGIGLGIIVTLAFFVGSPMFGGFDMASR